MSIGKTCGATFCMSLCCDGVRQEGTRRAGFSDRRDAVQTPLMFEIFQTTLLSTGVVAAAEIGDKTMLLAVFLAARFRKPWTIILGIFGVIGFNG